MQATPSEFSVTSFISAPHTRCARSKKLSGKSRQTSSCTVNSPAVAKRNPPPYLRAAKRRQAFYASLAIASCQDLAMPWCDQGIAVTPGTDVKKIGWSGGRTVQKCMPAKPWLLHIIHLEVFLPASACPDAAARQKPVYIGV